MVANLIATILVVSIHYNFAVETAISPEAGTLCWLQEFAANGIARSAVPFFALLAGFFADRSLKKYGYLTFLKTKWKTLCIPYASAAFVILMLVTLLSRIIQTNFHQPFTLYNALRSISVYPVAVQFWFLRDLMVLAVVSPVLFYRKSLPACLMGILFGALWLLNLQPFPLISGWYLVNSESLFFFWLGGLAHRNNIFTERIALGNCRTRTALSLAWLILIAVRIQAAPSIDVWYTTDYTLSALFLYKAATAIGVLCIIQLSAPLKNCRFLVYCSGLTFFVYLFHFKPLAYFSKITTHLVAPEFAFYLNVPVAVIASFAMAYFCSKRFPRIYRLLTGARTPNKTLARIIPNQD